jgi:hypothetical protein
MVTFIDPSAYNQQQQRQEAATNVVSSESPRPCSPIYSRPLPRNQRGGQGGQFEYTSQQYQPSPGKSILKKPPLMREDGDGEAATEHGGQGIADPLYTAMGASSPSSYLETNFDTASGGSGDNGGKCGPPTLPKPLMSLDITQHPTPQLPQLRNLDVLPDQQLALAADNFQTMALARSGDRQLRPTDSADRRVRNCTQV